VGIELEGLEGLHFEYAQYAALARLCKDLALRYPIAHVAGHEHIAPGRKATRVLVLIGPACKNCLAGRPSAFPQSDPLPAISRCATNVDSPPTTCAHKLPAMRRCAP